MKGEGNLSKINKERKGCKDVFNAFMVCDATYGGEYEIPAINVIDEIPNRLISFSKAMEAKDSNYWIHFYEDDYKIERIWKNPQKYLQKLQKFNGVITPDFSLYRDMPFVMQSWNTYRGRAIGHWLQTKGMAVIPNVRWGDSRTYDLCCEGVGNHSIISIGSHGCIKILREREYFIQGLESVVRKLRPKKLFSQ